MKPLLLRTRRLELKAATPELAAADVNNRIEFCRLLEANVPPDWPPPLNDDNSKAFTLRYLQDNPGAVGWAAWYFLLPGQFAEKPQAIGMGGFAAMPSPQGEVEIGYSILPSHQRAGYASEAIAALTGWAFSHPEVNQVTAQTLPALVASIRVLEKNGFDFLGEGAEKGVIKYGKQENLDAATSGMRNRKQCGTDN